MKLRTKGNSIRPRLTQSEVASLAVEGSITESALLSDTDVIYEARQDSEAQVVKVGFSERRIEITIPSKLIPAWSLSDQVGI